MNCLHLFVTPKSEGPSEAVFGRSLNDDPWSEAVYSLYQSRARDQFQVLIFRSSSLIPFSKVLVAWFSSISRTAISGSDTNTVMGIDRFAFNIGDPTAFFIPDAYRT